MTGSLLNGWANQSLCAAWHWLNVLLLYQFSSIWKPRTAAVCYFSRTTLNVPWQGLPMLYTVSHAIRNQNQNQNQWACDYLSMQSLNLTMLVYQLVYTLGNLTCKFAHECHCPPVSLFSCTVTHECMLSIKWSSWTRALYVTIIWGFDIFSKYGLHRTTGLCVSTTIFVPKTRNRHCSMQIHKKHDRRIFDPNQAGYINLKVAGLYDKNRDLNGRQRILWRLNVSPGELPPHSLCKCAPPCQAMLPKYLHLFG